MLEIGRLCIKIAGKDAGKLVVIVDNIDSSFVLIDGPIKRKRCNILHLEPTKQVIKIKKNASHVEVVKEFKKLKIEIKTTKPKTKKSEKPVKQKKKKTKPEPKEVKKKEKKKEKAKKKEVKKAEKKTKKK